MRDFTTKKRNFFYFFFTLFKGVKVNFTISQLEGTAEQPLILTLDLFPLTGFRNTGIVTSRRF